MTLNSENTDRHGTTGDAAEEAAASVARRDEVEAAVRKLIQWVGEDPDREGLVDTPKRVVKAFEEFFSGYKTDPTEFLERTFEETDGYDEMIVLRDIAFVSHCEHHILPVVGKAHVAYLPDKRVVGIRKLARVVEALGGKRGLEAEDVLCGWLQGSGRHNKSCRVKQAPGRHDEAAAGGRRQVEVSCSLTPAGARNGSWPPRDCLRRA